MGRKILYPVLCLTLVWATHCLSSAQDGASVWSAEGDDDTWQQQAVDQELVTFDDGLDILGAALESRRRVGPADCSHLVHAIYERAGFPYRYSNSVQIYSGIEEFLQVPRPQPGDLVVWRGHVGIVISPAKRSFFSALRSGRGVEKYDSAYWRSHGPPRFFRYVKGSSTSASGAYSGAGQPAN